MMRKLFVLLGCVVLFAAVLAGSLPSAWVRNRNAIGVSKAIASGNKVLLEQADDALMAADRDCRMFWFLGLVEERLGNQKKTNEYWEKALYCSPQYLQLVETKAGRNLALAEIATKAQPDRAEAWFWKASLETPGSPEQAFYAYQYGLLLDPGKSDAWVALGNLLASMDSRTALRYFADLESKFTDVDNAGVEIEIEFLHAKVLSGSSPDQAAAIYAEALQRKPYDGKRWLEYGDVLKKINPEKAIAAYYQACIHGDPGSHGCYNAGMLAEETGDIQQAIRYYRLSHWEVAKNKAAELEKTAP